MISLEEIRCLISELLVALQLVGSRIAINCSMRMIYWGRLLLRLVKMLHSSSSQLRSLVRRSLWRLFHRVGVQYIELMKVHILVLIQFLLLLLPQIMFKPLLQSVAQSQWLLPPL